MAGCYKCGHHGHIAVNCTWEEELTDPRPVWCGTCDPRTRHVDLGDRVRRCECHPESHKLPGHMRRCPTCKVITVVWDQAECGRHHIAGQHPVFVGPQRIPDDEWRAMHAIAVPRDDFPGGLPAPPEYPEDTGRP